jgi:glycosyltransferase involved in cell wall biosynthesis
MKPQINDFYRTSDLFILGSRVSKERDRDGIPNVILEAMASGLPVVATNCGGIPEVIEHRLTGLLVPPDDPLAMADAIVELLRDDKLQNGLATNARTEIEKHFDLHVNVLALCELFDPCLLH